MLNTKTIQETQDFLLNLIVTEFACVFSKIREVGGILQDVINTPPSNKLHSASLYRPFLKDRGIE